MNLYCFYHYFTDRLIDASIDTIMSTLCKLCHKKFEKYPNTSKYDRRTLSYKIPKTHVTVYTVMKTVYDFKVSRGQKMKFYTDV